MAASTSNSAINTGADQITQLAATSVPAAMANTAPMARTGRPASPSARSSSEPSLLVVRALELELDADVHDADAPPPSSVAN